MTDAVAIALITASQALVALVLRNQHKLRIERQEQAKRLEQKVTSTVAEASAQHAETLGQIQDTGAEVKRLVNGNMEAAVARANEMADILSLIDPAAVEDARKRLKTLSDDQMVPPKPKFP